MAANDREFTLIGKFDDQITKKLKEINDTVTKLNKPLDKDNFTKSVVDGFSAANKELDVLQKHLDSLNKFQMKFDKSGITAAKEEAEALGRTIRDVEKSGFEFDRSGLKAAQEDASVLGDILKANALIKVGEGFANALTAGATSAVSILQRGAGFFGAQFKSAVEDQMEDLQARGSLFGALTKAGVLKSGTAADMEAGYRQTKIISRANEQAIGELIRTSSVSTSVVTTLNRQMTDNLLPTLLKARGITSLSGKSRDEMDKLFGGEKGKPGIGTELARIYEQMATVIPNPAYATMAGMGFTQAITSGTINRQLAVFENNPVLVDALKTIDGGIQGTADVGKRIQILRKALEVAAPTMMLEEMRQTLGGGFQAVQDTIMNPTVGILSLGADIANEGKKTLAQYKATQADEIQRDRIIRNLREMADRRKLAGIQREEFIEKNTKIQMDKLYEAVENADSPIEKISIGLAPVLQSFASFINTFGNLFLGPVTSAMNSLYGPLAAFQRTLDYLTTDVEQFNKTNGKEGRSIGEALGRAFAEMFKALAQYFNPQKAGKEIGDGINTFFDDFMKGFKSDKIDGEKYLKIVMETLQSIIMKLLFKGGDVFAGMTPLGDALAKVFALLAAPAFTLALISGLAPLALGGIGSMLGKVFKGLTAKVAEKAAQETAEKVIPKVIPAWKTAYLGPGAAAGAAPAPPLLAPAAGGVGALVGTVLGVLVIVALLTAAFVIFEKPLRALADSLMKWGAKFNESKNWAASAFGVVLQGIGLLLKGLTDFFTGIWDILSGMFSGDEKKIINGIKKIFGGIVQALVGAAVSIVGLGGVVIVAIGNLFKAIAKRILGFSTDEEPKKGPKPGEAGTVGGKRGTYVRTKGGMGLVDAKGNIIPQSAPSSRGSGGRREGAANAFGSANPFYGSLSEAINFEMANKPAGSHLVIANSSETIIPAAGGFGDGLQGLISAIWGAAQLTSSSITQEIDRSTSVTVSSLGRGLDRMSSQTVYSLSRGFSVTQATFRDGQNETTRAIDRSLTATSRQNSQLLQAIKAVAAAGGFAGGKMELGGGYGGAGVRLAGMLGNYIKSTGGAPGSIWEHPWHGGVKGRHAAGSYHYAGRAIDIGAYANEQAGVISRVQQFNRMMGVRPVEFLHAGNRADHQDHVHVAYAMGPGRPALFSSQSAAEAWERRVVPSSLKVKSITTNSGEASFGSTTINAPITIYQQPNQDPEELASIVAMRIGMVVDEIRNRM